MKAGDKILVTRKALYNTHGRAPAERTTTKTVLSVQDRPGFQIVRLAEHPERAFFFKHDILSSVHPTKLRYEISKGDGK